MEDNVKIIGSLLQSAAEYGKKSLELIKLKALDKTSDVVSSFIPPSVVLVFLSSFILFSGLGLAFWLGEILGKIYFGFFAVAAFYCFTGIFIRAFMYKWLKKIARNFMIKHVLK